MKPKKKKIAFDCPIPESEIRNKTAKEKNITREELDRDTLLKTAKQRLKNKSGNNSPESSSL